MWGSISNPARDIATAALPDKVVAAAAVAPDATSPQPPVDLVPHVPSNYPHFTPFVENVDQYKAMYQRSIEDPDGFWADIASEFHWHKKWDEKHTSWNFDVRNGPIHVEWFKGGLTNIAYNCLDRHVAAGRGDQPCFLWEGNEPKDSAVMTYSQVLGEVCRMANYLRSIGVGKGDAVSIYMPMVCELPIAMLACARIGAVHSVVFGGFSAEALAGRIADCKAKVLITSSGVMRGSKKIDLKAIADKAVEMAELNDEHLVSTVVVQEVKHAVTREHTHFVQGRDVWWEDALRGQPTEAEVEWVEADHPLFLLYTSGSTGKPKGVVHCTGGYMVYTFTTTKYVFNMAPGDVYWCTADCGWITGHSYLTYGPLLVGASQVVFEGVPTYPAADRCWQVVDKYKVKQFYTAPTAIRSLMRAGELYVKEHNRDSLRILGSVGEPINPEAWRWYHDVVGDGRCPIVDTWWQTETGGHMITPLPNTWQQKPGSATLPFFGVVPVIVDDKANELQGEAEGMLCIKQAWPSTLRTVYGDHDRYETNYFKPFPGYYFSGDGARRDKDGYFWITGRVDDVINVSGHRIGTAEVESALVAHPKCAEAAVVGFEHAIKGQGIYAFVTLMEGESYTEDLRRELIASVRSHIGAFAAPDAIHWAPGLPKTRSGKIMRRVLRKIASKEEDQLGDISTLADPSVVQQLVDLRGK
ncbi:acetyl-CoA synthetase [Monoraphidium neglectum]|uniref:Acetyl-coenzyme A synthetase n=1 Tax=Monoraphidium neglectum TaxID=145388 RepID=A0A0D2LJJ3_9CHLO|nr:acetyl-CoA synthetase [Monoraphidium neglectum]KIZ06574.1 acetyl-CoA synthetase [Monoraphidium neglectum]|eukprot:XP_013905593.1 acetyl-CoA synthetase [Monoraphidium neglectum]